MYLQRGFYWGALCPAITWCHVACFWFDLTCSHFSKLYSSTFPHVKCRNKNKEMFDSFVHLLISRLVQHQLSLSSGRLWWAVICLSEGWRFNPRPQQSTCRSILQARCWTPNCSRCCVWMQTWVVKSAFSGRIYKYSPFTIYPTDTWFKGLKWSSRSVLEPLVNTESVSPSVLDNLSQPTGRLMIRIGRSVSDTLTDWLCMCVSISSGLFDSRLVLKAFWSSLWCVCTALCWFYMKAAGNGILSWHCCC